MPFEIPNRPFASDHITGLMLPDGIFESSLGQQQLNVHFKNAGATSENNVSIYVESTSNPGIVVTPQTHSITSLSASATTLQHWDIDVSAAPAGCYYISFIIENTTGSRQRIIKKIFVTRVSFNPATGAFSAETPEGVFTIKLNTILDPGKGNCCKQKRPKADNTPSYTDMFTNLARTFKGATSIKDLCPIIILPTNYTTGITPTPPFSGQYDDLPFNDPWWKVLLAIIAFLLLVASAIAEAIDGTGSVTATTTCTIDPSTGATVCAPSASGGGTSYIAAGLLAAAAAVATAAVLSDERDLHRIGQDKTIPAAGEWTVYESLTAAIKYPEDIVPGRPFAVDVSWAYTRTTMDVSMISHDYVYTETVTNHNVHLLSRYEINAPNVIRVYRRQPFIIEGRFFDTDNALLKGAELFVKCFLIHDDGISINFLLQDDGMKPDTEANDGTYTGVHYFNIKDEGMWKIFVIAQHINNAQPDMKPEEAAQIIGGMILTNQLSISFSGGQCNMVPDGDVQVIA